MWVSVFCMAGQGVITFSESSAHNRVRLLTLLLVHQYCPCLRTSQKNKRMIKSVSFQRGISVRARLVTVPAVSNKSYVIWRRLYIQQKQDQRVMTTRSAKNATPCEHRRVTSQGI